MSEIREIIKQQQRASRNSRIYGYIATGIIGVLVCATVYTTKVSVEAKQEAVKLNTKLENSLEQLQEKNIALEISEENLKGEKAKLEEIQASYDSLRTEVIRQQNEDQLWDYAVEQNTMEAYSDYIKIKGVTDKVINKLDGILTRRGYVQTVESDGTELFKRLPNSPDSLNLYTPKSARSIRQGVIGKQQKVARTGDVILPGQIVQIIRGDIKSGKTTWARIKY